MPMSSAEIAQLNGSFQQASMMRMSYASAISQGPVYGAQGGAGADAMMGSVMNRGSSIGGPMLGGAMGLMGLDPMSLGLRAGMGAFGAGAGLGGAVAAGGAVALPLMAAGAVANYAGNQMYTGAQQQLALNDTLRSNYTFRNQYGGAGFSRGDMSQIGGMVRGMAEQFGPGGEVANFGELSQLAGKMSSMGLAQGVRDVQEFSRRFKDMVGTLKSMAKDLGTTLEGAMEFAASAKQSGVFGMGNIGRFTNAIRAASVSGGLAISEVTGAASIGSQISRSVGGLGSQGAMAGIRTIGQIGTAQQMGVLSEEAIYNATGLTGAEGRQAFAASQLQRAGSWLQSGRGRRMLASVAGRNGTLDESAVEQIMSGGMGIAETMAADRSHVTGPGAPVNRANFIRNEGRLRGAALARFGAFLPAMQLQQWASSKGIDINEMDDRSMLFAQRQLGMGRDEIDAAVKMANNMPAITRQMQQSERQDQYLQQLAMQRKGQGISGIKQRYEQARETINNKLQKVGQDVFNSGSDLIDNFINDLMGTYVETFSKDIDEGMRHLAMGGLAGQRAARDFGLGGMGQVGRFAGPAIAMRGGGRQAGDLARQMSRGVTGDFWENVTRGAKGGMGTSLGLGTAMGALGGATGGGLAWVLQGESGISQMQREGFDLRGMNSQQMEAKLRSIDMARTAYATSGLTSMTAETRDKIRSAYVHGVGGSGDSRVVSIQAALERSDPALAKRLREAATPEEKAAIIGQIERGAGIGGGGSALDANYKAASGLPIAPPGGFTSDSEENKAYARAMGAGAYGKTEKAGGAVGSALSVMGAGAVMGPLGMVAALVSPKGKESLATKAGRAGQDLIARQTGTYDKEQAAGEFYKGKEFRDMALGLMSTDPLERAAARDRIQQAALDVGEKGKNYTEYQKMLSAAEANDALERVGGDESKLSAEDRAKVQANRQVLGSMKGALAEQWRRDQAEMSRRFKIQGTADIKRLAAAGVYDASTGRLTADTSKLSERALEVVHAAIDVSERESRGDVAGVGEAGQRFGRRMGELTEKEARQTGALLAGTAQGQELMYTAGLAARVGREKRGGLKSLLNKELGLGMSAQDMNAMTPEGLAAMSGVTDPKAIKNLQNVFKGGSNMQIAQALKDLQEDPGFKKHKEEMSKAEAEKNDPFGAEQVKETKKTNTYLEALVKSNEAAKGLLSKIEASQGDQNPENKK